MESLLFLNYSNAAQDEYAGHWNREVLIIQSSMTKRQIFLDFKSQSPLLLAPVFFIIQEERVGRNLLLPVPPGI